MKFCDILLFKNMSEREITQMNKSKFMKNAFMQKHTYLSYGRCYRQRRNCALGKCHYREH